ncbi:MAG TPA: rhomboid family intramembrane serine protease [Methylovirgula sp.]|nr:rhomboid family intramembrane serine protease [Methylovirgula sp.]
MSKPTFGRREAIPAAGAVPGSLPAYPIPVARPVAAKAPPMPVMPVAEKVTRAAPSDERTGIFARWPLLTVGLIALLGFIFYLESRFAFDIDRAGGISLDSLLAYGGASYDRIVDGGEWWRLFLAPLLHQSLGHLIGNCVALLFVGWRLEALVGRAWLAGLFVFGAFGGLAGSLMGNPHYVFTVGASGAITALIGALFALSFHDRAHPDQRKVMRAVALRFGIPALLPLVFGSAASHVDYHAHLGGAVTGYLVGLILTSFWSGARPPLTGLATISSVAGLGAAIGASVLVPNQITAYAPHAAQMIPAAELPTTDGEGFSRAADLVARFPQDPRAHLIQALAYLKSRNLSGADRQFRETIALLRDTATASANPAREMAETYLAVTLFAEGRRGEAKELAAPLCQAAKRPTNRQLLVKVHLCS